MKLIEIKNNFAKLYYLPAEEDLHIGDFLTINDGTKKLCAQVITIESTSKDDTNCAVVKFSFDFTEKCSATAYTGYVPTLDSKVCKTDTAIIKSIFSKTDKSLILGDFVSYPEIEFCVDTSFCDNFTCVQADKIENTRFIIDILSKSSGSGLVVDFEGLLNIEDTRKFALGEDFKLPISAETLNYIYENDLIGLTLEQKAIIQDIVLEIQEYIESQDSGYIPFNTLLSVVDEIYKEDKSVSIILFRNKLLKYGQMKIFASDEAEIETLFEALEKGELVSLNLESVPANWKKETLNFVIGHINGELSLFAHLEDESVDKKLLVSLYKKQNIKPVISTSYSSKYSTTCKSFAKNLVLFAPEDVQKSYPTYTSFLSMLKEEDFVLTGEQTYFTPLILTPPSLKTSDDLEEKTIEEPEIVDELPEILEDETDVSEIKTIFEESVEDEIAKDVDSIFYAGSKKQEPDLEQESSIFDDSEPETQILDEISEEPIAIEPEIPTLHEESDILISDDEIFSEDDLDILDELDGADDGEEIIELDIGQDEEPVSNEHAQAAEEELPRIVDEATVEMQQESFEDNFADISELDEMTEDEMDILDELSADSDVDETPKPEVPNIPVYTTGMDENLRPDETIKVAEGNIVYHQKYGRGVVEQIITYGKKTLCSIQFDNVGRRLLDPNLADLKQA